MIRMIAAACLAAAVLSPLSRCGTLSSPVVASSTGKPVVPAAKVGQDLTALSADLALLRDVLALKQGVDQTVLTDVSQGVTALSAAGASLQTSPATSGDLKANVQLGAAAITAALAGIGAAAPGSSAAVDAQLLRNAVAIYNADAPLLDLPPLAVGTAAAASAAN